MDGQARPSKGRRELGRTDTFNSSLATVVPDNFNRTLTQADFEPSSEGSSSGPLGSQSSMGRLDRALAAGDEGLMHLLEGPGDGEFERLIHEIESLPPDSQPLASQSSLIFELPTFMTDIPSSSDDPAPYPQTASPLDLNMGMPTVSPNMLQHHQADRSADASSSSYSAHGTEFRPQSAQSYHSHRSHRSHATSISGSEYSFSSTDVSEDYDMEGRGSTAADGVRQLNMAGMRLGDSAQRAYPGGNSPITPGPSTGIGPIRGISEEEEKRQAKLEHRRQINRKSAQKHRQRRREESETLTRAIAERDLRIALLEKDLAVERARLQQLMSLVRTAKGRQPAAEDMNEGTGQAARGAPSSGDTDTNELGKRRSMRLRGAASTDSSVIMCAPTEP